MKIHTTKAAAAVAKRNNTTAFSLLLEHCPNIDIMHLGSGYWVPPADPKRTAKIVSSLQTARAEFIAWRERNGLGGGNLTEHSGKVIQDGKLVGHFSYNGRFWKNGKEVAI